jgi:hypothetical protein
MAVGTLFMFYRCGNADFVAQLTGNICMPSFQHKSSPAVIKITGRFQVPERFLHMALGTVLSKFIVMRIRVTTGTVLKF